jgi:transcriptional regulator with XRE-family HTH domain
MTPDRLRECLGALNWSTAALATMAQVSPVTARRWQAGKRSVPERVGTAIEAMARAVEQLSDKPSDSPTT